MIKNIIVSLLLFSLTSCSLSKFNEEHNIANTLNKESLSYFKKDTVYLYHKGEVLRNRKNLSYLFYYKNLYKLYTVNEEFNYRIWFDEGYKYCVSANDIDYILDTYLDDNKNIKWNRKKLKSTQILKKINIGSTLKDTAVFQIKRNKNNQLWTNISKPYFTKNKNYAISIFSNSTLTMNGEEGLYILAKEKNEWIIVGKIFIGIN